MGSAWWTESKPFLVEPPPLHYPRTCKVSGILTGFINPAFASEVLSFQHFYLPIKEAQAWEEADTDHEECTQLPSPKPKSECPQNTGVNGYVVLALGIIPWKDWQAWNILLSPIIAECLGYSAEFTTFHHRGPPIFLTFQAFVGDSSA